MSSGQGAELFWSRGVLLLIGGGISILAMIFSTKPLLEAWLLTYVTLAGLAAGALGLLMIGHLLGEYWLNPVRDELEAAALTMPLLAILAVPIAFSLAQVFPWAAGSSNLELPEPRAVYLDPEFFLVRSAIYLGIWSILAAWIAQPGKHRRRSAVGLALLTPSATLAGVDWVMSRDPDWWSSLFGLVFAITQLLPALAAAVLLTILRPHQPDRKQLRSLERALITLTLLIPWLWFVQFLIIWMADLPHEVRWYLVRYQNWGWAMPSIILAGLISGVLALLPPIVGGFLLRIGVTLLLIQHLVHMIWLINPAAGAISWFNLVPVVALSVIWSLWAWSALARRRNVDHGLSA